MASVKIGSEITSRIKALEGPSNYFIWASQMRNCLNLLGGGVHWQITSGSPLWSVITGEDARSKWIAADYQATAFIASWIPASMQHLVPHEQEVVYGTGADIGTILEKQSTSQRLWDYLASIYRPQRIAAIFGAFQEVP